MATEQLPGTRIEKYRVVRTLGRGRAGETYLALDTEKGRHVALTYYSHERFGNKQISGPFLDAVRTKSSFEHPAIAAVLGTGEHADRPYVAFEYVEGESLRERMRAGLVPLKEILRIGAGIASGLADAHKKNAFHHDLRPEKVMLGRDGQVKILDLGITRLVQRVLSTSPTGNSLATVSDYLAPEQVRGDAPAGAADLWATGVMLFELATGAPPFSSRIAQTFIEQVGNADKVRRMPTTPRQTPNEIADIIYKLLDKAPAQRPIAQEAHDSMRRLLAIPIDPNAPPFAGLLPYVEAQAAYFAGRDTEIAACVERLQRVPMLIVAGASGTGKTSFVQAGLFARLRPEYEPLVIQPGTQPLQALAAAFPEEANLAERLRADPMIFGAAIARRVEKGSKRVLLFLDRAEQLASSPDASVCLRAVASAARDRQSPVRVIVAMNERFLDELAPHLDAPRDVFVLKSPDAAALAEIVQRPLASANHTFDDPSLAQQIANDAATLSHPLLRLSFLLSQLWAKRDPNAKTLPRAEYDTLGGVARVLELYADWALSGATLEQKRIVRDICMSLVSTDEVALAVRRDALLGGLKAGADNILERLLGVGLLVAKPGDGEPEIELMHDALIDAWPLLRQWIDERAAEIGFLSDLDRAAAQWKAEGEQALRTFSGDTLHLAAERMKTLTLKPSPEAQRFVTAGLKREARKNAGRRVLIGGVWAALGAVAIGTTLYGLRQYKTVRDLEAVRAQTAHERADAQREDARSALIAAQLGNGQGLVQARAQTRASLEAEDSTLARTLWADLDRSPVIWKKTVGSEATAPALAPDGKVVYAKGTALVTLDPTTAEAQIVRLQLDTRVRAVAVSSKGTIVIADQKGAVAMVDVASGKTTPIGSVQGGITALAFSPDGDALTVATKGGASVLNVATPGEPVAAKSGAKAAAYRAGGGALALIGGDDSVLILDAKSLAEQGKVDVEGVRSLAYAQEGIVTGDSEGRVRVFDEKGASKTLLSLKKEITGLSLVGEKLVTLQSDGVLSYYDLGKAKAAAASTGGAGGPKTERTDTSVVAFVGDGNAFVTIGEGAQAELWDLASARPAKTLTGHTKRIQVLDVSADGSLIATGGADGTTRIWNSKGEEVKTLTGGGSVRRVKIVDKKTVITGHADGNIKVWNIAKGSSKNAVRAYGDLAMAISPDGKHAITGTGGSSQVWKVQGGRGERTFSPSGARFVTMSYSPKSDELATGDSKGKVQVWPAKGAAKVVGSHEGAVNQVIWDAAGKRLISAGADRAIIIWDLAGAEPVKITDVGFEPKTVAISKDGTKLVAAGADGALKAMTLPTTDPYWRAPLLLRTGPEVVTHTGFHPLAQTAQPAADKAWRKALAERARLAGESKDSALVCFMTRDKLELWDVQNDRLVSQNPATKLDDLVVTPKGCVTRAAALVNFYPLEGEVRTLSATATAVGLDGETIVVAEAGSATTFSADGSKGASVAIPPGAIAIGRSGETIVVGFDDGGLAAVSAAGNLVLGFGPTSRITRIVPGPQGTIAATDQDGFVGLWDVASGRLLDQRRLAARPTQLVFAGSGLYAADERGGYTSLDLSILTLDYCALVKTVWAAVPVVWSSGRAVVAPPPADHRCK